LLLGVWNIISKVNEGMLLVFIEKKVIFFSNGIYVFFMSQGGRRILTQFIMCTTNKDSR